MPAWKGLVGSDDVAPETRRVVVPGIKRDPGERREVVASAFACGCLAVREPLAHQHGFAVARWRDKQRELAREGGVKLREQSPS